MASSEWEVKGEAAAMNADLNMRMARAFKGEPARLSGRGGDDKPSATPKQGQVHTHDPHLKSPPALPSYAAVVSPPAYAESRDGRRKVQTATEEMMDHLRVREATTKTGDKVFVRHHTVVWESPDVVSALVTPEYAVVLNQHSGFMEARWWDEETLGTTRPVWRAVQLRDSQGYTPETLPLFSHDGTGTVLGVCDNLGRVTIWDPTSGAVVWGFTVTEEPLDPESTCLFEPSVFALSAEFVVVCKALTDKVSAVYSGRWRAKPELGVCGAQEPVLDKFIQAMGHPRFGCVNRDYPFEFFIACDFGVGILNLVVPPPMRCVVPALEWLKACHVEGADAAAQFAIGSDLVEMVLNYTIRIETWCMPPFRATVDTPGWAYAKNRGEGGDSALTGNPEHPVCIDHAAFVEPLRWVTTPVVPDSYRCVHLSGDSGILVGTAPCRTVWVDREAMAYCPAAAVSAAIMSEPLPKGMVTITADLSLAYIETPIVDNRIVMTSTLLQLTHDTSVREEMRAVTRPQKGDDGTLIKRGAPPGSMLSVTKKRGLIVCHTVEDRVWVYTVEAINIAAADELAEALAGLKIDKDAKIESVLDAEPEEEYPSARAAGLSLRTGPPIADIWYEAARDISDAHREDKLKAAAENTPSVDTGDQVVRYPRQTRHRRPQHELTRNRPSPPAQLVSAMDAEEPVAAPAPDDATIISSPRQMPGAPEIRLSTFGRPPPGPAHQRSKSNGHFAGDTEMGSAPAKPAVHRPPEPVGWIALAESIAGDSDSDSVASE